MMSFQTTTTATMQVHDDLAALLAQKLTFNPALVHVPEPTQPKINYSISQHYHHSAHVPRVAVPEPEPAPEQDLLMDTEPAQPEVLAVEAQLRQHGIDPAALTHVQMALFRMATPDRRDYLLQLWRICPPTRDDAAQKVAMSLDGTPVPVAPAEQAQQAADGRWLQSSSQSYMEPYMLSGYEELARREYLASALDADMGGPPVSRSLDSVYHSSATDPVYNNRLDADMGRASWPQQHQSLAMDMENQYGSLMVMRDSAMEL